MDSNTINLLKEKGDNAFKMGNLEEALRYYSDSIDAADKENHDVIAVILSNRAQVHLNMKNYEQALKDAGRSLKLDPTFKKSLLRCAKANIELNNFNQAIHDLRTFLTFEPRNPTAIQLMKRCSDKPTMDNNLCFVYIKCCLRRALKQSWNKQGEFGPLLLRQLLLSTQNFDITSQLLFGALVYPSNDDFKIELSLLKWFLVQLYRLKLSTSPITLSLSDELFSVLIQLIKPGIFELSVDELNFMNKVGPLEKYCELHYYKNIPTVGSQIDENDLRLIEQNADSMTRFMYLPEILKFKSNQFSNANTLLFNSKVKIDIEFLKLWQEKKWPVKKVTFLEKIPSLKVFKQFGGVVSDQVTETFMFYADHNCVDFEGAHYMFCNKLAILKKSFPSLANVTGVVSYFLNVEAFPSFIHQSLKPLILNSTTAIDKKYDWCSKFQILFVVILLHSTFEELKQYDFEELQNSVKSYSRQLKLVKNLRFCGPSIASFTWNSAVPAFFMIEFETDMAEFQIAFISGDHCS